MDPDELDAAAFVEAVNNAEDDELAAADAEGTSGEGGCFSLVLFALIVLIIALAFLLVMTILRA